jgi:hypothetical protein
MVGIIMIMPPLRYLFERRTASQKDQPQFADGAITVLANEDVGQACMRRISMVHLIPVEEDDEISVLLKRTAVAEIRQHRPFVFSVLHIPVELPKGDDRNV